MTKNLFTILVLSLYYQITFAQKASDVLENGNPVTKGHHIFLKYDLFDGSLKVDDVKTNEDVDFITIEDSVIYLVRKKAINIYLHPLNPINYMYSTETKIIIDPINESAEKVLDNIVGVLENVIKPTIKKPATTSEQNGKKITIKESTEACIAFTNLKTKTGTIQQKLIDSKKDDISKIFENLKAITFSDEQSTINALSNAKNDIKKIEDYFLETEGLISEAKKSVELLPCTDPDPFILKYIFNSILKEFSVIVAEQKNRLKNLKAAYKLVEDMQKKASIGGGTTSLKWCIPLNEISSKEGKIYIYTITIKESGYKLSDNKEIISIESKEVNKKKLRFRKFQRFIPEVSVGTAFTFFKYNTYGTTSDSSGIQYVASPTENLVRNINITTMINFNYYIPNSPIHPLWQLGVGVNSGIPTLMSGLGLRIKAGQRRFAITGGLAMTWIKELEKLKVGDKISGTDDIDKDLKFQFVKPTSYIGIQYNF